MKKTAILLLCVLLCGCGQKIQPVSEIKPIKEVAPVESVSVPINIEIEAAEEEQEEFITETETAKETVVVEKVVDGDTFWATFSNGESKKIRLIGIDTPESVAPDESRNTKEGEEASAYVKALLQSGDMVFLEYDAATEDKYGRTLAYVYLTNGEMLQDILLKDGYAKTMTVQPNVKYQEHFMKVQEEARENSIGFWNDYFGEAD